MATSSGAAGWPAACRTAAATSRARRSRRDPSERRRRGAALRSRQPRGSLPDARWHRAIVWMLQLTPNGYEIAFRGRQGVGRHLSCVRHRTRRRGRAEHRRLDGAGPDLVEDRPVSGGIGSDRLDDAQGLVGSAHRGEVLCPIGAALEVERDGAGSRRPCSRLLRAASRPSRGRLGTAPRARARAAGRSPPPMTRRRAAARARRAPVPPRRGRTAACPSRRWRRRRWRHPDPCRAIAASPTRPTPARRRRGPGGQRPTGSCRASALVTAPCRDPGSGAGRRRSDRSWPSGPAAGPPTTPASPAGRSRSSGRGRRSSAAPGRHEARHSARAGRAPRRGSARAGGSASASNGGRRRRVTRRPVGRSTRSPRPR